MRYRDPDPFSRPKPNPHPCPQAKFIFKSDDDVYVNSDALWAALESTHQYFKSVSYTDSTDGSEVTKAGLSNYVLIPRPFFG